jgi:hypothetical protein
VGLIETILVRGSKVSFLVSVYDCVRDSSRLFWAVPKNIVKTIGYEKLADYKPIVKRSQGKSFFFCLHHHVQFKGCQS